MQLVNHTDREIRLPSGRRLAPGKNDLPAALRRRDARYIAAMPTRLTLVEGAGRVRAFPARDVPFVAEVPVDLDNITREAIAFASLRQLVRVAEALGMVEADLAIAAEDDEERLGLRSLLARAVFKDF